MQVRTPFELGALIRAHRLTLGMSQQELAIRVGVSRLWIVQTERGNPGASLELVLRTLTELGVTLVASSKSADSGTTASDAPPPVYGPDIGAILDAARRR